MDLSLIISIFAIAISIITLWLSELRGPNISLLNAPEFETTDETLNKNRRDTPMWLGLKRVAFVFANYGGKAGTVVALEFDFGPSDSFKVFFDRLYCTFQPSYPPLTLEKGGNQHLEASLQIVTIDWKKMVLAEVLDQNLKMDNIIGKTLEESKEKFKSFCDFLATSEELGKISCTITFTKGRFRTKVTKTKLFRDITVANHYREAVSYLRGFLPEWETLSPTKAELLNEIKRDLDGMTRELNDNLIILGKQVNEQNITAAKLRVDAWNNSQNIWRPYEKKIRWFLIESVEGLEEALIELYRSIMKFNSAVDELLSLGVLRTQEHFREINAEREKLRSDVEKTLHRLSDLQSSYFSQHAF
jgi:hypothetical protein